MVSFQEKVFGMVKWSFTFTFCFSCNWAISSTCVKGPVSALRYRTVQQAVIIIIQQQHYYYCWTKEAAIHTTNHCVIVILLTLLE